MEFPEIVLCYANTMNSSYLKTQNISDGLARYLQNTFQFNMERFEDSAMEKQEHLEMQYQDLLKMYPNQDIREFMFEAGVQCENFIKTCIFNNFHEFNCCESAIPTFTR